MKLTIILLQPKFGISYIFYALAEVKVVGWNDQYWEI